MLAGTFYLASGVLLRLIAGVVSAILLPSVPALLQLFNVLFWFGFVLVFRLGGGVVSCIERLTHWLSRQRRFPPAPAAPQSRVHVTESDWDWIEDEGLDEDWNYDLIFPTGVAEPAAPQARRPIPLTPLAARITALSLGAAVIGSVAGAVRHDGAEGWGRIEVAVLGGVIGLFLPMFLGLLVSFFAALIGLFAVLLGMTLLGFGRRLSNRAWRLCADLVGWLDLVVYRWTELPLYRLETWLWQEKPDRHAAASAPCAVACRDQRAIQSTETDKRAPRRAGGSDE